tara:strand:- start:410 stop:1717 length:1308 start_codon:yes stop_codon:yes gene_type:complete
MKFSKWKTQQESMNTMDSGKSESGTDIIEQPFLEKLQESDDPAADIDVENPEWFQDLIEYRRKDKRNTSIFVLGAPRAGKSYTALTLSEVTDAQGDFDVESHVVMHTADFVRKINEFPEGCNIMYDEGGAGHSSRRFMSKMNIMMNAVLQTFGSRYINVVWTVPNMKMEDVTARQLCTFSIRMIARGKGIIYSHWSDVHTGKPYWRRLGNYVQFDKPFQDNKKQIKVYEKMKRDYQTEMYQSIARELDQLENDEKNAVKLKDPQYLAKAIKNAGIDDFLTEKGTLNAFAVKAAFVGAPMNVIYTAKEVLKQRYGLGIGRTKLSTGVLYEAPTNQDQTPILRPQDFDSSQQNPLQPFARPQLKPEISPPLVSSSPSVSLDLSEPDTQGIPLELSSKTSVLEPESLAKKVLNLDPVRTHQKKVQKQDFEHGQLIELD